MSGPLARPSPRPDGRGRSRGQKLQKQKTIQIDYRVVKGCDHFFQRHLDEMIGHVDGYLDKNFIPVEPTE